MIVLFCELYGDHRDLHGLTHSFPTRRSSDLRGDDTVGPAGGWAAADFTIGKYFPETPFRQWLQPAIQTLFELDDVEQKFSGEERDHHRSEEHTSELQSLMRISYAVFCLKKKKTIKPILKHNSKSYIIF